MSNTQPYTVMTVCTGNICRSPMGEIILRHFFNERGLGDQVNVESSGVSDEEWSHPIDRVPCACYANVAMVMRFRVTTSHTASRVRKSTVPTCSCR